jgi:hypothetical protein
VSKDFIFGAPNITNFAIPDRFTQDWVVLQRILPILGKALLELPEAERLTGISAWTLRKEIKAKRLACYRRGGTRGKIRLSIQDLESYLARQRYAAIGE